MTEHGLTIVEQGRTPLVTYYALRGQIDEASSFAPILASATATVSLDLGEVTRINSTGVREWLRFVASLEASSKKLVLERCSVPIVQQLNMITGFAGNGVVASVFAPYYCNACESGDRQLIELSATITVDQLEQAISCSRCGGMMEFDDLASSFLGFRVAHR